MICFEVGDEVYHDRGELSRRGIITKADRRYSNCGRRRSAMNYIVMFDGEEFPSRLAEWDELRRPSLLERIALSVSED